MKICYDMLERTIFILFIGNSESYDDVVILSNGMETTT